VADADPGDGKQPRLSFAHINVGVEMAAPIVLLMFVGYMLDGWLGSEPAFLLVGALVGIALGFYNAFRRFLPPGKGGPKP
jgi:F0F1-type ATP synthase assembly protein I